MRCIRTGYVSLALALALWFGPFCAVAKTAAAKTAPASQALAPSSPTARLEAVNLESLRLAIEDMSRAFPQQFPLGAQYLERLNALAARQASLRDALAKGGASPEKDIAAFIEEAAALQREALLRNPLLDFQQLLVIKRKPNGDPRRAEGEGYGLGEFLGLPRQSSWQLDEIPKTLGWENEIAVMDLRAVTAARDNNNAARANNDTTRADDDSALKTIFMPSSPRLVSGLDLHWNAGKLLFSMPDERKLWQVYEIGAAGGTPRLIIPADQPRVHNFDARYLPNGNIAFLSTAAIQGVPCNASVNVAMLYLMDMARGKIRRLSYDQDHNYCPTVMNDGRILYLRWEYTDIPHVWARYLFTMNPDGTNQREFYGSGSYWPNSIFYTRPIPDHPTKVVGIVTGHHVGRVGELVLFDPGKARYSSDGVVQRIPGRSKKVEPIIEDRLTLNTWPKFLHPWPLSEKYFLVACKPSPKDLWGIYLVDVFDNMTLIKEVEGYALLEPIPLRKQPSKPVIADRVNLDQHNSIIYLEDIYAGRGLKNVPRGAVKQMRLFTYHFAYQNLAGIVDRVGADGPWEPKRILGTVPVEADGSALFRVPANTPISYQALDAEGRAVQLMRSWSTSMPGENVSCSGCHESQNGTPNSRRVTVASRREPSEIQPWRGPARGFSFEREVQPVLDKYCVSCHNGEKKNDGGAPFDLRASRDSFFVLKNQDPAWKLVSGASKDALLKKYGGVFPPAFGWLRPYIRVGKFESDIRILYPGEFHAETSELIQMLRKGHHGVRLDEEAWDRLYVWIDLNAPCHGTWTDTVGEKRVQEDHALRRRLRALHGADDEDPETYPPMAIAAAITPVKPPPASAQKKPDVVTCANWPLEGAEAVRRQAALGLMTRKLDLGEGVELELMHIPAGQFVMGDENGGEDEHPLAAVMIAKPFWMGRFEITNEQYARFDSAHESRFEHKGSWSFSEHHNGWPLDGPKQPVVRVSQKEAMEYCRWLAHKTGENATLPTEAQWEYACRAGAATPFYFGDAKSDYSPYANVADAITKQIAYDTDGRYTADMLPRDDRFNDGALVTTDVGHYRPNVWGLHDMHGNAWEWTRSIYKPYPYAPGDGRESLVEGARMVARGGSWRDRPQRCQAAFRLDYPDWMRVYNVGFRIVIEEGAPAPERTRIAHITKGEGL
ncbi:MAG: SUMF1/EgtB/PvdO family nonheme iron enzyme [Candidatus Sumerlaeota bacterium]|nr:SUMF1/EgtB/PvdO family nonheme iron enzyme [Candidatus Sumerlaeota bacterium]